MSSTRRLSQNLSSSANKLRLDSLNKILKIDSSKSRKSKKESLVKQISKVALSDLIKDTPAKSSDDLPDFKSFLSNKDNLKLFREFLKTQYCQENIDFYVACERYQLIEPEKVGVELIQFMANQIFNDYLSENARQPVNINYNCLQSIKRNMIEPKRDLFINAQMEIFNLMKSDCYPRFCKTWQLDRETARRILCENTNSNTSTSTPLVGYKSKKESDTTFTSLISNTTISNVTSQSSITTSLQSRGKKRKLTSSSSSGCPPECLYYRVGLPCQQHSSDPENLTEQSGTTDLIDRIDLSRLHKVPNCCKRRTPPPPPLPPKPEVKADSDMSNKRKKICPYVAIYLNQHASACRIGSERIKTYVRKSVERMLNAERLKLLYWPEEPFHPEALSKAIGLGVTLAESRFSLEDELQDKSRNETVDLKLIQDLVISCVSDRERKHSIIINLELNNPFKVFDLQFLYNHQAGSKSQLQELSSQKTGLIRLRLPSSTLLVRLNQHIKANDCLDVTYVQLSPNTAYEIECLNCNDWQKKYLDNIFSKKMAQFDAEIDSMISEKFLLGLRSLLDQQRLELDLFMS